jgi:hypothetical protein
MDWARLVRRPVALVSQHPWSTYITHATSLLFLGVPLPTINLLSFFLLFSFGAAESCVLLCFWATLFVAALCWRLAEAETITLINSLAAITVAGPQISYLAMKAEMRLEQSFVLQSLFLIRPSFFLQK